MKSSNHPKHARLPPTYRVSKRALVRPAVPSQYRSSASPKVIWVRVRTPLRSTIARVNRLLEQVRRRTADGTAADERLLAKDRVGGKTTRSSRQGLRGGAGGDSQEATGGRRSQDQRSAEAILLKGAGRAVGRVLEIGAWFQQRPDQYRIHLRTGETTVVDDIVRADDGAGGEHVSGGDAGTAHKDRRDGEDVKMVDTGVEAHSDPEAEDEATDRPRETEIQNSARRVRTLNTLEVHISFA